MKLSKFLAGFAWINVFAMIWIIAIGIFSDRIDSAISGLILFLVVALFASAIQSQEKK